MIGQPYTPAERSAEGDYFFPFGLGFDFPAGFAAGATDEAAGGADAVSVGAADVLAGGADAEVLADAESAGELDALPAGSPPFPFTQ